MREQGTTLVEMLVAVGILMTLLALAAPALRAYSEDAEVVGAADVFQGEFRKARSIAAMTGVQTAIRFEEAADGSYVSVYQDGNHNGVLSADIARGVDKRVSGPRRLGSYVRGARVGIRPGTPAIPPERGVLDTSDPIRFGRSEMLSFTPLGGATPGTLYVAAAGLQAAIRVTGDTGRVRTLVYRGGQWRQR